MLESSTPPLAHEFTASKAAPSTTSSERTNGKVNFTPLPKPELLKTKQDEYAALERQAIADSEAEIKLAKENNKDKTEASEAIKPAITSLSPSKSTPPPEMPPPVTATQLAEARAELQQAKASGQGTAAEHAQVDQALRNMEKQLGLTEKAAVPKVEPVVKRVSSNVVTKPEPVAKASTETKVDSGSKQSLLTKIASIVEKIFSIPSAIWRFLTAWITK